MERRKFDGEFKVEAVNLVRARGVSIVQAAGKYFRLPDHFWQPGGLPNACPGFVLVRKAASANVDQKYLLGLEKTNNGRNVDKQGAFAGH